MHKAGLQIKEAIEEYKQALRALGINVERVILYGSYIKEGKVTKPGIKTISKIAKALGVTVDELINPVRNTKSLRNKSKISNGVN